MFFSKFSFHSGTPRSFGFCCLLLILAGLPVLDSYGVAQQNLVDPPVIKDPVVLPKRDIRYEETGVAPDWKQTWDTARDLFRRNKLGKAFIQYEILLAQKENIDEARWEYAVIALQLKRWNIAAEQLDILISHNPGNRKYLFASADLHLATENREGAKTLFTTLLSSSEINEEKIHALEGLIGIYSQTGVTDAALLKLQETLLTLKPGDYTLRVNAIKIALELHLAPKADSLIKYFSPAPDKPELLKLHAAIADQLGDNDKALEYRLHYIETVPDDPEVLHQLATHFQNQGDFEQALTYVEKLLELEPGNTKYLLLGAEFSLLVDRADKSLDFYNKYLRAVPGDLAIMEKKHSALQTMAADLLVLVENDGSRLLWRDLVRVTDDRLAIYKIMADLLRERNKKEELINVLTIIHEDDPGDGGVGEELTQLLAEKGYSKESVEILNGNGKEVNQEETGKETLPIPSPEKMAVESEITP